MNIETSSRLLETLAPQFLGEATVTSESKKRKIAVSDSAEEKLVTTIFSRKASLTFDHYKQIVLELISETLPKEMEVETESLESMAKALEFSNITSIDEARSLRLSVIPPGAVFHTWYAKFGTGIFDGEKNPEHLKHINYVARIKEQAGRLEQWGIPLLIVYFEQNMEPEEIKRMACIFKDHKNILVINFDKELKQLPFYKTYTSRRYPQLLDDPRCSLCADAQLFLTEALKLAVKKGKYELASKLNNLGGLSITYSDIDNTFTRKPIFQLAPCGFRDVACIRDNFSLNTHDTSSMSNQDKEHSSKFTHLGSWFKKLPRYESVLLKEKNDELYEYLLSGEAFKYIRTINPSFNSEVSSIFEMKTLGFMCVNTQPREVQPLNYSEQFLGLNWCKEMNSITNGSVKLQKLLMLQQLRFVHIGCDKSWCYAQQKRAPTFSS